MTDQEIIELYMSRSENAITETKARYAEYCYVIAYQILGNHEDSEEILNDTWYGAWNAIPPTKPSSLRAFLAKISRQLALKKRREQLALKRGKGEVAACLEELEANIADEKTIEREANRNLLKEALNDFLGMLSEQERNVFICRYWYFDTINEIATRFGFGESKVKMMLLRTRKKLFNYLKTEGFIDER